MSKGTTVVPFSGTKAQEDELKALIAKYKDEKGALMPVMQGAQGIYGYLPIEVQEMIADGLEVDGAEYIDKPNFGWSHWNEWTFDEIEMVGLCTDICVVSNALILKAEFPEVKITVDASCCAGVTPESHEAALLTMKMCQIDVINE